MPTKEIHRRFYDAVFELVVALNPYALICRMLPRAGCQLAADL